MAAANRDGSHGAPYSLGIIRVSLIKSGSLTRPIKITARTLSSDYLRGQLKAVSLIEAGTYFFSECPSLR
jgi:hypothetical protein